MKSAVFERFCNSLNTSQNSLHSAAFSIFVFDAENFLMN